ncbi:rubrerythrin family protein [Thermodesulfobacteriota bacterium]
MRGKRIVINILNFFWLFLMPMFTFGEDMPRYPETIAVLRELYKCEITACKIYSAFAQKALEEKCGSVERLFQALRKAESIHARNFENLLTALGNAIGEVPESDIKMGRTKNNLRYALDVELSEIDMRYPEYIERVKKEGNEEAIRDITYAWKAEMQHRDLIKKMQSAIGLFFGKIVQKLKGADRYFVCQRCGATLFEIPKDTCIICSSPVSKYEEMK